MSGVQEHFKTLRMHTCMSVCAWVCNPATATTLTTTEGESEREREREKRKETRKQYLIILSIGHLR